MSLVRHRSRKPRGGPKSIPERGVKAFRYMFYVLTRIIPQDNLGSYGKETLNAYLAVRVRKAVRSLLVPEYKNGMSRCDQVRLVTKEGESGTPEIVFVVQWVRNPPGQS